jgi:hypothetical protein
MSISLWVVVTEKVKAIFSVTMVGFEEMGFQFLCSTQGKMNSSVYSWSQERKKGERWEGRSERNCAPEASALGCRFLSLSPSQSEVQGLVTQAEAVLGFCAFNLWDLMLFPGSIRVDLKPRTLRWCLENRKIAHCEKPTIWCQCVV